MDSLLKEHAMMKKNGEVDEQFLQDLEERLDAEEASAIVDNKVVSLNIDEGEASSSQTSVRSWALGLGLAACATFEFRFLILKIMSVMLKIPNFEPKNIRCFVC